MHLFPIGKSSNSKTVYAHLTHEPLASGVARNPHLLTLVSEIVAISELRDTPETVITHDMKRPIGYSAHLETKDTDVVFYAKTSKHQPDFTRFVRMRQAERSTMLTIKLVKDPLGDFELTDAWIGAPYPPVPADDTASEQSKTYWANHAVVYNGQALLTSTITKVCPY